MDKSSTEANLSTTFDLDGEQTRAILLLAIHYQLLTQNNPKSSTLQPKPQTPKPPEADVRPSALRLGKVLPGSSNDRFHPQPALPQPAGLKSLGSVEDLEQKAEELKNMRKAGKGIAKQVLAKVKMVADKMTEMNGLQEQLAAKPEHLFLGNFWM